MGREIAKVLSQSPQPKSSAQVGRLEVSRARGLDEFDQPGGGVSAHKGDGRGQPPMAAHPLGLGQRIHVVVPSLDQDVWLEGLDDLQRRVLVKPSHQTHALQGRHDVRSVQQRIEGPLGAFAQALGRCVGVQRHDQMLAKSAGFFKVGHMSLVQNIKNTVGKDQGPLGFEFLTLLDRFLRGDNFVFNGENDGWCGHGQHVARGGVGDDI